MRTRDLWEWLVEDIVKNPLLANDLEWDARKTSVFMDKEWVRFVDEPWTAKLFYKAQVCPMVHIEGPP